MNLRNPNPRFLYSEDLRVLRKFLFNNLIFLFFKKKNLLYFRGRYADAKGDLMPHGQYSIGYPKSKILQNPCKLKLRLRWGLSSQQLVSKC